MSGWVASHFKTKSNIVYRLWLWRTKANTCDPENTSVSFQLFNYCPMSNSIIYIHIVLKFFFISLQIRYLSIYLFYYMICYNIWASTNACSIYVYSMKQLCLSIMHLDICTHSPSFVNID